MVLTRDNIDPSNTDNLLDFLDSLSCVQLDLIDHLVYIAKCEKNFYEENPDEQASTLDAVRS